MKNVEVKIVTKTQEIVKLASLIHKFFEETHPNYTESDFYRKIITYPDQIIVYVEEDGIPVAYQMALVVNNITERVVLLLQGYSLRPLYLRKTVPIIDTWALEHDIETQIALVIPDRVNYFSMLYKMQPISVLMQKKLSREKENKLSLNGKSKEEAII